MKGYWKRPQETKDCLSEDELVSTATSAGWMRTPTCTFSTARMIRSKGYQVAPAELEAVLHEHPAVLDAAVIPKARATWRAARNPQGSRGAPGGLRGQHEELMAFVADHRRRQEIREMEYI